MARYQESTSGAWAKGQDVVSGTKCRIVSEVAPRPSSFMDKEGNPKTQDVGKVRFDGKDDSLNVSFNRASINALVNAFGDDSAKWQGNELTVFTEKVMVAGKRVVTMYFVPEGYEMKENQEGFINIVKVGDEVNSTSEDDLNAELAGK